MRHRWIVLGVVSAAAGLSGCGGGGGSSTPAATPASVVIASATQASVKQGGSTTIDVDAFDGAGKREAFTFASTDPYATVTQQPNGALSVAGVTPGRQRITATSASGARKAIDVDVYDPLTMDIGGGLMIKYVHTYDRRFTNFIPPFIVVGNFQLQGAHPRTGGNGWYALGSYIYGSYDDLGALKQYAMLVVKDTSVAQDRLKAPTGYTLIWNSAGSPMPDQPSVWNPVCPAGYVAMGMVLKAGWDAPSVDDVRCVNAAQTVPGKVGPRIVDDRGSSADLDITWFESVRPDNLPTPEGMAFLPAGTQVAGNTPGSVANPASVNAASVNVLVVNLPVVRKGDARDYEPKLAGFAPYESRVSRSQAAVRVPFQLVGDPDPNHTLDWKVTNSPFYTVVREEVYTSGQSIDNRQSSNPTTMSYQTEFGWSQTDATRFTQEVGIRVTTGGSFKFVSAEVEVSFKLGWEQSTSTTYSEVQTSTYQWTVPPGKFAQVLHVTSRMRVLTETGADAGLLPMKSNILKYLQYPL